MGTDNEVEVQLALEVARLKAINAELLAALQEILMHSGEYDHRRFSKLNLDENLPTAADVYGILREPTS